MHKIRVAAYCRVSKTQDEQYSSLQAQTKYYSKFINRKCDWDFIGVYCDRASGCSNRKMPKFQDMMSACREGLIDLILVKSISRFGRNTLEMLQAFNELKALNVKVYFEVERLSLNDPKSDLMLTIYSALAQEESETRSYSIRWGIRQGFRNGTSGFLHRTCFGYRKMANGTLAINEEEAEVVKQIYHWRDDGASLREISAKLKKRNILAPRGGKTWGAETLRKMLANEKYTGNVLLQKTYVKDVLSGKQIMNQGQLDRYLVCSNHPSILF
jgi:site-specific DNA recombinase